MTYPSGSETLILYGPLMLENGSKLKTATVREPLVHDRLGIQALVPGTVFRGKVITIIIKSLDKLIPEEYSLMAENPGGLNKCLELK